MLAQAISRRVAAPLRGCSPPSSTAARPAGLGRPPPALWASSRRSALLSPPQARPLSAAAAAAAAAAAPLRIGFIGAGDISNLHAEGIAALDSATLHGLWSRADAQVPDPAAVAKKFGCALYDSAEALVADPDIDAVFVLTNFETHEHYATLAMQAGKHVMCEKPVGAEVAELERLQAVAEQNGVVLMPGHNYIYEPPLMRTKQMLSDGKLGKITSVYVVYNIHHPEDVCARYPGVIKQILTHHAYTALYLLPPSDQPVTLSAFRSTIRDEDGGSAPQENHAMVNMMTAGGAMVHLCASFAADDHSADPWSFYIKVIGTKGSARYSYNDWMENAAHIVHSHTYAPYPYTVQALDKFFVEEVMAKGAAPLSTLSDAILAQKICEAAEESCETGRHVAL